MKKTLLLLPILLVAISASCSGWTLGEKIDPEEYQRPPMTPALPKGTWVVIKRSSGETTAAQIASIAKVILKSHMIGNAEIIDYDYTIQVGEKLSSGEFPQKVAASQALLLLK